MPETPDFEQIARAVVEANDNADGEGMDGYAAFLPINYEGRLARDIAEQLRLIWNARGAADIAKLEATVFFVRGGSDAGLVEPLDHALRTLDAH